MQPVPFSDPLPALDPALLDIVPAGVYVCAADGVIVHFNRRAEALWGRAPRVGDTDQRFCGSFRLWNPDGSQLPHDGTPMAQVLRSGEAVHDQTVVIERPDGSRVTVLVNIAPLFDERGRIAGAVNCFVDVSARVRDDGARQRLAALVEYSDDAIISKNLEGRIQTWNLGAERLFGYSESEAVGESILCLVPEEREAEEKMILDHIRRGKRVAPYDTLRLHKDGRRLEVSVAVSPIHDAAGRIVGASNITRDISERKRAEQALARHGEEQSALYALTDRLQRAATRDEILEAGLDAIQSALHCPRASILLFDDDEVMRFVAWRGLSDHYRAATTGHTPWRPDTPDPEPIAFDDVSTAPLDEPLRRTIRSEGIGALAFIPILAGRRVGGKFMAYFDSPHVFERRELDLGLSIAHQLALALERLRVEAARQQVEGELCASETRERARASELETIMAAVPAVIWIARDREAARIEGNAASHQYLRLPQGSNLSLTAPEAERPRHFRVYQEGRPLEPHELPVQRAARGETLRDIEVENRFDDGTSRFIFGNANPLYDADGNPSGAVAAFVDITDRKRAERQRELLVAELNHRVKNTLATVISIARQSFSGEPLLVAARQSFEARLRSLAQAHGRLAESSWSGASLETMLVDELEPFRERGRESVRLSGPPVTLAPKAAVSLGMAIHELATNAAKHGALSVPGGRVDVEWSVEPTDQQLHIGWVEHGGPEVVAPARSGFGRLLLERALPSDLGGDVRLTFSREGLRCEMDVPLGETAATPV